MFADKIIHCHMSKGLASTSKRFCILQFEHVRDAFQIKQDVNARIIADVELLFTMIAMHTELFCRDTNIS